MEYANFREIVKKYLTINNEIIEIREMMAEVEEEMDEIVATKKEEYDALKTQIPDRLTQMAALEPFIMEFMQKEDLKDINTNIGKIKYKETNSKKRLTKEVIKERVEKLFENHEKRDEILKMIFDTEEREKRAALKCQMQPAETTENTPSA